MVYFLKRVVASERLDSKPRLAAAGGRFVFAGHAIEMVEQLI
jgi:hypothetical protein